MPRVSSYRTSQLQTIVTVWRSGGLSWSLVQANLIPRLPVVDTVDHGAVLTISIVVIWGRRSTPNEKADKGLTNFLRPLSKVSHRKSASMPRSLAFTSLGARESRAKASEDARDACATMGLRIRDLMESIDDPALREDPHLRSVVLDLQRALGGIDPFLNKVERRLATSTQKKTQNPPLIAANSPPSPAGVSPGGTSDGEHDYSSEEGNANGSTEQSELPKQSADTEIHGPSVGHGGMATNEQDTLLDRVRKAVMGPLDDGREKKVWIVVNFCGWCVGLSSQAVGHSTAWKRDRALSFMYCGYSRMSFC